MSLTTWLKSQPRLAQVAAAIVLATGSLSWIVGLEAFLRARLDREGSAAPTRLYGRSLVLQAGTTAERERVERHLRRLGYREARGRTVAIGEYALGSEAWTIGRRPFRLADRIDPGGVTRVQLGWDDEILSVEDDQGGPLQYLFLEPELLHTVHGDDLADRMPVKLGEVPQHLVDAVLSVEDKRFLDHQGLDFRRIVGAAVANAKAGRTTQGASTITQQLARTRWLSTRRTPWRKIREAVMARTLESRYAKHDILEAYLNEVYLGHDGAFAIRGVGGSACKPIVALAALTPDTTGGYDAPAPITLATELDDEPLSLDTPAGMWRPVNYDGEYRGRVTLRQALERSLNVPFARLGLAVGPKRIAETGRLLGIESPLHAVPSLALGSSEVTLLELTRAFAVLAAYGYRVRTVGTLGVLDAAGELMERADLRGEQVMAPAVAYLVTSALEGAVERGTGRGLRAFGFDGPVAAKSGTTNDHRDAWFVGYTPRLAVGVWVGFDDGRSVGLPGAAAALPIFARFLSGAMPDGNRYEFPVPDGVEFADAGPGCETEVFLAGTAPERRCAPYWLSLRPMRDGVRSLVGALRRLLGGH